MSASLDTLCQINTALITQDVLYCTAIRTQVQDPLLIRDVCISSILFCKFKVLPLTVENKNYACGCYLDGSLMVEFQSFALLQNHNENT